MFPRKALFVNTDQGKGFDISRLLSHESVCVSWNVIDGKILTEALQCSLPALSCLQANDLGAIASEHRVLHAAPRPVRSLSFSDFIF